MYVCKSHTERTRMIIHFIHGRLMNFLRKSFDIKHHCVRPFGTVLKIEKTETQRQNAGKMDKNVYQQLTKIKITIGRCLKKVYHISLVWMGRCVDFDFCQKWRQNQLFMVLYCSCFLFSSKILLIAFDIFVRVEMVVGVVVCVFWRCASVAP